MGKKKQRKLKQVPKQKLKPIPPHMTREQMTKAWLSSSGYSSKASEEVLKWFKPKRR